MNLQFFIASITCYSLSAWAQGGDSASGFSASSFIPMMVVMFAVIYFFMIRPEQKKQKAKQKMINEIKKGDKILTVGGIYGSVVNTKEDSLSIRVAENAVIKISKTAISSVLNTTTDKQTPQVEKK